MLWRVLQAHGGELPPDVIVCFANTGREMPATLDFVRDCGAAWNVPVSWLEYRWKPGGPYVEEVSHNSASRDGEPFEALLRSKSMLPNPVSRFCTIELKIRTQARFVRRKFGWSRWTNVVGLRADEAGRVNAALARAKLRKDRWDVACPLAAARIDVLDVHGFWKSQPFDLRLSGTWEGNCDGCFLKSRAAIERMLLEHPDRMEWWSKMEAVPRGYGRGATFRVDRESYAKMAQTVRNQGRLDLTYDDVMRPCMEGHCGV